LNRRNKRSPLKEYLSIIEMYILSLVFISKINWEIRTPPPKKGKKKKLPPSSPMEWLIIIFYLAVCEQPQKISSTLISIPRMLLVACSIHGTSGFFKLKNPQF
jgi:hypothetical protein